MMTRSEWARIADRLYAIMLAGHTVAVRLPSFASTYEVRSDLKNGLWQDRTYAECIIELDEFILKHDIPYAEEVSEYTKVKAKVYQEPLFWEAQGGGEANEV